jgi:hypothetical protein
MSSLKPTNSPKATSKPMLEVDEFCPKCGVAKFANWPHKCLPRPKK